MEHQQNSPQISEQSYALAANLLFNQRKTADEAIVALSSEGLDTEAATTVVEELQTQLQKLKKEKANKDMLYGALWCVGGIAATAADIGFIFWGAIVFGGIQFFRGVANA